MNKPMMVAAATGAILAVLPTISAAQDSGWTFQGSIYGWTAGLDASVDTPRGTVDADLSIHDVLSDLDMAFMGTLEARNGRWGFIGDYIYTDLTAKENTPFGVLFREAKVESTLSVFSGYAAYRAYETPRVAVDVAAGFRWVDLDTKTTLESGQAPTQIFKGGDTWADPLVGARVILPFDEKWFAMGFADIGGYWTQDSSTWQALAVIGYRFNPVWSASAGYRYMSIENEIEGNDVSLDLSGPLIGVTAQF